MAELERQDRLISLDVFRGITIAGMILVNNPGSWSSIYSPLKHAEWHGITPTDYVFPFFLFIVGVAIPISLSKNIASHEVYLKIFRRSLAIFASGIALSAIPFYQMTKTGIPGPAKWLGMFSLVAAMFFLFTRKFKTSFVFVAIWIAVVAVSFLAGYEIVPYDISTMRIPGVLQRIAVCYLIASLIFLRTGWRMQAVIGIGLLLLYWLLMTAVSVPGCAVTTIDDKACNLAAWIDRSILTEAHIWRSAKVFDPEGILSTMTAVATTLSGVLSGKWLTRKRTDDLQKHNLETVAGMFVFGSVLLAAGWTWSLVFPINKSLWTSSYVIYTSGLALLTLSMCYWLTDIKGWKKWAHPFVVFGVNALALFIFSGFMARMLGIAKVAGPEDKDISLQQWIYKSLFLSVVDPLNASLAYAVCFILFWFFLMRLLYRRRIFIKV